MSMETKCIIECLPTMKCNTLIETAKTHLARLCIRGKEHYMYDSCEAVANYQVTNVNTVTTKTTNDCKNIDVWDPSERKQKTLKCQMSLERVSLRTMMLMKFLMLILSLEVLIDAVIRVKEWFNKQVDKVAAEDTITFHVEDLDVNSNDGDWVICFKY